MKTGYFDSAELSDVGRKRKNNEDACVRIPEQGVYCVADGMGGVVGGDLASEAITTAIQDTFKKHPQGDAQDLASRIAVFRRAVNSASKWIRNFAEEKVIGQMGSTVVAILFYPPNPTRAVALHAGDSRLHRFRGGELKVLTNDHSAVAALAAKLGRDPDTLPAKYQNELLRAVGLAETVELERTPVEVQSGDLFLLCSDGLTRMVPNPAIAKILKRADHEPLATVAKALIDAANEAGGKDNITAVLVKIGDLTGLPQLPEPPPDPPLEPEAEADTAGATLAGSGDIDAPVTPNAFTPGRDTPDAIHGETPRTDDKTPEEAVTPQAQTPVTPQAAEPETKEEPPAIAKPKPTETKAELESITPAAAVVAAPVAATKPEPPITVAGAPVVEKKPEPPVVAAVTPVPQTKSAPPVEAATVTKPAPQAPPAVAAPQPVAAPKPAQPQVSASPATSSGSGKGLWILGGAVVVVGIIVAVIFAMKPSSKPSSTPIAVASAPAKTQPATTARAPTPPAPAPQKNAAVTPPAPAPTPPQPKAEYVQALQTARTALANRDAAGALAAATAALKLSPGDAEATKIQDEAKAVLAAAAAQQQEREQNYQSALKAAQAAFDKQDFAAVIGKADEALALKPAAPEAAKLKAAAQAKLAEQKAREETYQMALKSAREALGRKDFAGAMAKSSEALRVKPGDAPAVQLRAQASEAQDLVLAQEALAKSQYDQALAVCGKHADAPAFKALAASATAERQALAAATSQLAGGNYSFVTALRAQSYAGKKQFADLLTGAETEAAALEELQALKAANNWQAVAAKLAQEPVRNFAGKPPFRALTDWARATAAEAQSATALDRLDAEFETMLVWFNIRSAKDPYLRTAEGRAAKRIDGGIGVDFKKQCLDRLAVLDAEFRKGGWLNQRDRGKLLAELRETVTHRE